MSVSPPRPKGPPLNALRAFEAAARLGGFALAADELCVTPAAVSQHIKSLENWVGAELFERRSQGVKLTLQGVKLKDPFGQAFDALGNAVRDLRDVAEDSSVNIAALPGVAQLWLPAKLREIRKANPNLNISVTALETSPNLNREMFDVSLFLSPLSDGCSEKLIAEDAVMPVCAPKIASKISMVGDLEKFTWLYDATWADDWSFWLAKCKAKIPVKPGPSYSLYSLALEEAKAGAGILIGHTLLIKPLLESGELVAPFPRPVSTGQGLYLETAASVPGSTRLFQVTQSLSNA